MSWTVATSGLVHSNISHADSPLTFLVPKKRYWEGLKTINEFLNSFIERTLRIAPEELEQKTKSDEGYTFLHALAAYTRDRTVLRDQLIAILLAGRDTTASALSWLFFEISSKPHIVQKLRREIQEHIGFDRPPTYDDLKSMKYLQASVERCA